MFSAKFLLHRHTLMELIACLMSCELVMRSSSNTYTQSTEFHELRRLPRTIGLEHAGGQEMHGKLASYALGNKYKRASLYESNCLRKVQEDWRHVSGEARS
jgi:hypothetical protein